MKNKRDFPAGESFAPNVGDPGSIPGQRTGSHMLKLKSLHAATKYPACHKEDRRSHVVCCD